MGMSFWYIFTSVRMLLVLYSLFFFSLVIFQGIWPRCFSLVIFIWNDTHIFFIGTFNFDCFPAVSVWGPVLEGNFGWLALKVRVALQAPASFRTRTGLLQPLALRMVPGLPQTGPLCFPVSFCCLFSISPVLKSTDTPFLFSATSVQSCTHWGLRALVSTLSLEIQGIYRCYISCP